MNEFLKKAGLLIFETIKVVLISFAIILPIRFFLIQPFYVEGASMEPSFHSKEYLIIDEISYRFSDPERGEVVVLRYPRDRRQFFIKRIVGLPGERIRLENGIVSVNGRPLEESYVSELYMNNASMDEITLGADEYFVMGDNRTNSLDSRSFGPISRNAIVGRAWIRGWPFNRISLFSAPQY
ncbi:MAG: signal peptidase I [Candidatus Komeilibacteria bacterium]|nr:signal peptidase I [Candidatus Komeilibacteria bacterium]